MKEMNRPEVTLENASEAQNVQKLDVCDVGSVNNAGDLFQYKCRQATERARDMNDRPDRPKGAAQDEEERVLERKSEDSATDRAHDMNDRPGGPEDTMPDEGEPELEWRDEPEYRGEEHGDRIEKTDFIEREERARMSHKTQSKTFEQVPVDSTGFPTGE